MNCMSTEFKSDVKKLLENNKDIFDAFVDKFDEYLTDNSNDFLNNLEEIDERCLFIRLFLNYHNQVCNGGHYQYFDNGYASTETINKGCFSTKSNNIDLHHQMISLFQKYFDVSSNEIYKKFLSIISEFCNSITEEECNECEGSGEIEFESEDEDGYITTEYETCNYCNGSGVTDNYTCYNTDKLDTQYYEIYEKLLKYMHEDVLKWLNEDNVKIYTLNTQSNSLMKNKPRIKLIGIDGNAFVILGRCEAELRKIGKKDLIPEFRAKATSGDYDNLLRVCMEYFDIY